MSEPSRTLLVVYELSGGIEGDEERRTAFLDALRRYDGHKLTGNAELITTPRSAALVLSTLSRHLSPDDRLVVVEPARIGWSNIPDGFEIFDEFAQRPPPSESDRP